MQTTAHPEALAAEVRSLRHSLDRARAAHSHGIGSYEELAEAGRAYCEAFARYHLARFGKTKRLDYRAIIR